MSGDDSFATKTVKELVSSSMYPAITIGIYVHQLGFDLFNGSWQRITVAGVEFYDQSGTVTHTISASRVAEIWGTRE